MRVLLLFVLVFCNITCKALPTIKGEMFHCHQISTQRGLSSDRVFSLCRDKRGRLWAATKSGVDCYDGTHLYNYQLFNSEVVEDEMGHKTRLCKDIKHGITAYTNTGKVFVFDEFANRFKLKIDLGLVLNRPIYLFALILNGADAYACTSEGVYRINDHWRNVQLIHRTQAQDIAIDATHIYMATDNGVCRISKKGRSATKWFFEGISTQTVFPDAQTGLLWAGTKHKGMLLYNLKQGHTVSSPSLTSLPDKTYRSITPYNKTTLLLGIDGEGVYAAARNGSAAWRLLYTNGPVNARLKSNDVYDVMTDGSGNIWVGKYTEGVTICNLLRAHYRIDQHESGNPQSIINNHVNATLVDHNGNLWCATDDGLSICSPSGVWRHLYKGKVFLTLCQSPNGDVWTGSYGFGVWHLDSTGRLLQQLTTTNSQLTTNHVYSIYNDAHNNLWIGGLKGTLVCMTPQRQFRTFPIDYVHHITAIDRNILAIATANGFYIIDIANAKLRKLFDYPQRYGIRSNSYINFICPQDKNHLWLATDGGGLVLFNIATGKAHVYTTTNGLPSNYVYSVAIDAKRRVWTSTDHGLAYMQQPQQLHAAFSSLSTLNEQVFNYKPAAFYKSADGRFIYGSDNGVVSFNPLAFGNYHYQAPLHISGFSVSHSSGETDNLRDITVNEMLLKNNDIRLKYDENTFTISFSSISFQYQNDILYTYRMEDFDHAWSVPSRTTSARYTNLPPGSYTFHVRSISQNTGKQIAEARLTIRVARPWWNTLWAWAIYLLLASLAVYSIWRNYIGKLERKNFKNKLQFFVNTAHDIRTPVTLIINPLKDLDRNNSLVTADRHLLSLALNSAQNLYQFTTDLLNFQKMDIQTLNGKEMAVEPCNLKAYLTQVVTNCTSLLDEKALRLRLVLPQQEVTVLMNPKKIDHVLYNVITNAVKYNRYGGKIIIKLLQNKHNIVIAVRDTGIGIPQQSQKSLFTLFYRATNVVDSNQSGNGIGLAFARKIMQAHNGDITFNSTEGKGTTFLITFPRKQQQKPLQRLLSRRRKPTVQPDNPTEPATAPFTLTRPDAIQQPQATHQAPAEAKRLMIIEDNNDLRFYLRHIFEADYQVIDIADGEHALDYLKQNMVDFIISDVMMPGIQGDALCQKIKTSIETSHIPVILLTAKAGRDSMMKGFDCGADDYIPKPFDTEVLQAKVRNMISSQIKLRKNIIQQYQLKNNENESTNRLTDTKDNIALNEIDQKFLDHCISYITENMDNPDFNVNMLCRELAMSRTILYEKLKALTDKSPGEFITIIRMRKAADLLLKGEQVQEVAIKIGLSDANYFSTAFKKHYGVTPSQFKKSPPSNEIPT